MEKFDRLKMLIGEDVLFSLSTKTILVVGCGGVGQAVIEGLVRSNIGHIILVDPDCFDISNCNRQLLATKNTVGKKKVFCIEEHIKEINENCRVSIFDTKLTDKNINEIINFDIDYIIDACDDIKAKKSLILACNRKNISFISTMGTGKRLNPEHLTITTLDKTNNDPIARILRKFCKEQNLRNKIWVCFSKELPKKIEGKEIASCAFVPNCAGFLIASKVINDLIKEKQQI